MPFSNQGGYVNPELDTIIAGLGNGRHGGAHRSLPQFQQLVVADLPLINVAEWGFITVARDSVLNVSNNPRWAVSNWARYRAAIVIGSAAILLQRRCPA